MTLALRWLLGLCLLLVVGCDLETSYATRGRSSVNGVDGLRGVLKADPGLHTIATWNAQRALSDDASVLWHVCRQRHFSASNAATISALGDWLLQGQGRQVVLVLRDGELGATMLRTWADQALSATAATPEQRERQARHAQRWREHADRLDDETRADSDSEVSIRSEVAHAALALTYQHGSLRAVARLEGWSLEAAPPTLRIGRIPIVRVHGATVAMRPLLSVIDAFGERVPLVSDVQFGSSRLLVVANATGLLDAAQATPAGRRLTSALVAEVRAWASSDGQASRSAQVWLDSLDEGSRDIDMLSLLFATPPIAVVAWHLLAVLLVYVLWRNQYLGRREAALPPLHGHFIRHIDSLATALARQRAVAWAEQRIRAWRDHAAPPRNTHDP